MGRICAAEGMMAHELTADVRVEQRYGWTADRSHERQQHHEDQDTQRHDPTRKRRQRRKFLTDLAALSGGAAAAGALARLRAQAKSTKTGTVRVWGEPGPYGGVAVDGDERVGARSTRRASSSRSSRFRGTACT